MATEEGSDSLLARRQSLFRMKYNQRSQIDVQAKGLYGPKAKLIESSQMSKSHRSEDPSCDHHLTWSRPPEYILLMKKFRDREVTKRFKEIAKWLVEVPKPKVTVICEPAVLDDPLIKEEEFKSIADQLLTWDDGTKEDCLNEVDLIICIGGDGTLLYTSSMFQDSIPPIMSFHMGSLGFLTPFQYDTYKKDISRVFKGQVSITLRHRLVCEIRSQQTVSLPPSIPNSEEVCPVEPEKDFPVAPTKPRMPTKFETKIIISQEDLKTKMLVMNDVVVDRGPSPYLTNLELFCNGRIMTSVQGDGIIIATPTGSTAYSLAAGASMVHPSVPCMVVTPICPHSLSFRSIVVPSGVEITIRVAPDSRSTAWVAFDGRNRQEIKPGDSVVVSTSPSPVPSINNTGHVTDWFDSLAECLHWNVRREQKQLK